MRWIPALFIGFFVLTACQSPDPGQKKSDPSIPVSGKDPFNRHGKLVFTKHALCRMDCRHITAAEIYEIVNSGTINYAKSEPGARPDPKFALEGYTDQHQHLRIIIAPEREKLILVTCIELGVEWSCHCN